MKTLKSLAWIGTAVAWRAVVAAQVPSAPAPALEVMAETDALFWNGVAIDGGRIFVSGPRAFLPAGSTAPAVALIVDGNPVPYPDTAWNRWKTGDDPGRHFVNVNAIHREGKALWAIDSGTPIFGGKGLPGAPKAVKIDLATNQIARVYTFGPEVARPESYVNDIRFHGKNAYLTDAGRPGIIVLNLTSGEARRVLDHDPSTTGTRPIVVEGQTLRGADDHPLLVNADPLEVSPDGRWFYFGPAGGPWSQIETRWLDDPRASAEEVASHVRPWVNLPPTGGTAMDRSGNFYFTDLAHSGVKRRSPSGKIITLVEDPRLHWIDAPAIDEQGYLWLPVPQIDRAAAFNHGESKVHLPVQLFRFKLPFN